VSVSWPGKAIALDPTFAESYVLLANCELESARYSRCRELLERAIALDPANRNARWNLAILSLLQGTLPTAGVSSSPASNFSRRSSTMPATTRRSGWDSLNGRTILLHTEQGLGTRFSSSGLPRCSSRAAASRVIVECPYRSRHAERVEAWMPWWQERSVAAYDVHAFLMSLPTCSTFAWRRFRRRSVYSLRPSTSCGVDQRAGWLRRSASSGGHPVHHRDRLAPFAPERFIPLLSLPGRRVLVAEGRRRGAWLTSSRPGGQDVGSHLHDSATPQRSASAWTSSISVDTSVGASGRCTRPSHLVLLPQLPDFRSLLERTDSRWYPTMRLFRQPSPPVERGFCGLGGGIGGCDGLRTSCNHGAGA